MQISTRTTTFQAIAKRLGGFPRLTGRPPEPDQLRWRWGWGEPGDGQEGSGTREWLARATLQCILSIPTVSGLLEAVQRVPGGLGPAGGSWLAMQAAGSQGELKGG